MIVGTYIVLYIILSLLLSIYLHNQFGNNISNFNFLSLSFFCCLNILIAFWEIALGWHIKHIKEQADDLKKKFTKKPFDAVIQFFKAPVGMSDAFSLKFWSKVWSTYSLYDPSYSNQESYGFFIDVGNGWSTLLPSVLFVVGMSVDIIPARAFGLMGLIKFYQECYGTVLYFLSYILNGRYKGKTALEVSLFVGLSNGMWFFFPIFGMTSCIDIIYSESFDIFRK